METIDLLYPHLLSTETLKDYLRQRELRLTNIDQMPREDLLKIFTRYASPMHQRTNRKKSPVKQQSRLATSITTNGTSSGLKRTYEQIQDPSSTNTTLRTQNNDSMDDIVHEAKKNKIYDSNTTEQNDIGLKRLFNKMDIDNTSKAKRQKITWP